MRARIAPALAASILALAACGKKAEPPPPPPAVAPEPAPVPAATSEPASFVGRTWVVVESQQVAKYTVDGQEFSVRPGVKMTHKACKTPRLEFSVGEDGKDASERQTLRPRNNAHYVIRQGADGALQVEER